MKVLNADLFRKVIDVIIEHHFDHGEAPLAGAVSNLTFYIDALAVDGIVPVIRCKDCDNTCPGTNGLVCTMWGAGTDPDGWCYKAERKDNEKI